MLPEHKLSPGTPPPKDTSTGVCGVMCQMKKCAPFIAKIKAAEQRMAAWDTYATRHLIPQNRGEYVADYAKQKNIINANIWRGNQMRPPCKLRSKYANRQPNMKPLVTIQDTSAPWEVAGPGLLKSVTQRSAMELYKGLGINVAKEGLLSEGGKAIFGE
ncbi:MAG: hypothetical protein R3B72_19720 [Polyangiaceae bacterium]